MNNAAQKITVEALVEGSIAIERQRDEIRRFFQILKPFLVDRYFEGERFTLIEGNIRFWWELREEECDSPYLQLWGLQNGAFMCWDGTVDAVPSADKTKLVRMSLGFLLQDCVREIPDFYAKVHHYL